MNPGIGDLIKLWLLDEKSEWYHTNKIEWKSESGTFGSATSDAGFIVHPNSKHLEEVLWLDDAKVSNPCFTDPLLIADPEFFNKLRVVLFKTADIFKQNPSDREQMAFWGGPIDYVGNGAFTGGRAN